MERLSGMDRPSLIERELTESVLGAFFEVHSVLGFGFLEHVHSLALERELRARGHHVAREVPIRVMYKNAELSIQRLDMVVDGKLIVEAKSTIKLHESASRQLFNYLRATSFEVGLLLHFGPRANFFRLVCTRK